MATKNTTKSKSTKNNNNTKSTTKGDNKNSAKLLASKLQAEQMKKAQRFRLIFGGVIGVTVIALVVVVALIMILNPNSEANISNRITDAVETGSGPKSVVAKDGSIIVSKNGVGEGKLVANIPTVDIYNDFICPACGAFERQFSETIKELINNGSANFRFHPLAWFDHTSPQLDSNGKLPATDRKTYAYSTRAAAAVFYAVEHAPDKYMDILSAMYNPANQPKEGEQYDKELGSNDAIVTKLTQAGITPDVAKAAALGNSEQPPTDFASIDWKQDFPNASAGEYVKGTTGGPYIYFAQAVGQLVSKQGFVKGTPYVAINGTEWDMKKLGKDATPERFKSDILQASANKSK